MKLRALTTVLAGVLLSCGGSAGSDKSLAERLGKGLVAACPPVAADDEVARNKCAAALTDFTELKETMNEPFLWGGQQEDNVYELSSHVTRFNPFVYRRMYLSLFMFANDFKVEAVEGKTLLRFPSRFRNKLDMGSYPYPFWHSASKWSSYQTAAEVIFVIEKGRVQGALRSLAKDPGHSTVSYDWNGQWTWSQSGQQMPFVSLYTYLLSSKNPHAGALDKAFRALEGEFRNSNCLVCHSPDNQGAMPQLEFFNYPNQALYARHHIVERLEANTMPVADPLRGIPAGLADEPERLKLLELARAFAKAGDDALKFEGEYREAPR